MDPTAIASVASSMKQTQLMNSIGTAVMKKAMNVTEQQAQAVVEMANNMPKFNGEIGSLLDVRA